MVSPENFHQEPPGGSQRKPTQIGETILLIHFLYKNLWIEKKLKTRSVKPFYIFNILLLFS